MTEREAFIQSILENPDDDAPRLIYADWLEEHGGEPDYAEFIRVQCQLATYGDYRCEKWNGGMADELLGLPLLVDDAEDHPCVWCRLKKRERELLMATKPGQWSRFPKELCQGRVRDSGLWAFRRGFVEALRLGGEAWLKYANELVRLQPIREVELIMRPQVAMLEDEPNRRYECRLYLADEGGGFAGFFNAFVDYKSFENYPTGNLGQLGQAHDLAIREVLKAHWPRIKFAWPDAEQVYLYQRGTVVALEVSGDDNIEVGENVAEGPNGTVIPARHDERIVGIAMESAAPNELVRVSLSVPAAFPPSRLAANMAPPTTTLISPMAGITGPAFLSFNDTSLGEADLIEIDDGVPETDEEPERDTNWRQIQENYEQDR